MFTAGILKHFIDIITFASNAGWEYDKQKTEKFFNDFDATYDQERRMVVWNHMHDMVEDAIAWLT